MTGLAEAARAIVEEAKDAGGGSYLIERADLDALRAALEAHRPTVTCGNCGGPWHGETDCPSVAGGSAPPEIQDILSMSEEAVIAQAVVDGIDPASEAARGRELFEAARAGLSDLTLESVIKERDALQAKLTEYAIRIEALGGSVT